MSRNKNVDYVQYVHEFVDERGDTRFMVAQKEDEGIYSRPLDKRGKQSLPLRDYKEWGGKYNFGGYLTRKQALRRARYLFGGK